MLMGIYLPYSTSRSLNMFQNLVIFLVSYEHEITWSFTILTIFWTSICVTTILDHGKLGSSFAARWNQKKAWNSSNPAQCLMRAFHEISILWQLFPVRPKRCCGLIGHALQWPLGLGLGLPEGALPFFPVKKHMNYLLLTKSSCSCANSLTGFSKAEDLRWIPLFRQTWGIQSIHSLLNPLEDLSLKQQVTVNKYIGDVCVRCTVSQMLVYVNDLRKVLPFHLYVSK